MSEVVGTKRLCPGKPSNMVRAGNERSNNGRNLLGIVEIGRDSMMRMTSPFLIERQGGMCALTRVLLFSKRSYFGR